MRPYSFVLILLLISGPVAAQSYAFPEPANRVYSVPAKLLLDLRNNALDPAMMPDFGPALPGNVRRDSLPAGHYIHAALNGETVTYTYFSTHQYTLRAEGVNGKFNLRVFDLEGRERTDVSALADGRRLRYSRKHRALRRRDWRINDLTVFVGTDTLLYDVKEDINVSRFTHDWRHVKYKQPVPILLTPYYFARSTYFYGRAVIRDGYWGRIRYPGYRLVQRLKNPKAIIGYVAASQPKYRPGDTLRVSAFLTRENGRPLKTDSIEVHIRPRRQYKDLTVRTVAREEKGRYSLEMPIPADWPLDRDYTVSFDFTNYRLRNISPTINFRLEDYELAEYELTVEASDDARLPNSAWLDVKTQDVNGLALPNATVGLTVKPRSFSKSLDSVGTISLPDTLYVYSESTDNRIDRRLTLPDSLFPRGYAVDVDVEVQLTGPSGEYKTEKKQLTVDRRYPQIPEITVNDDSLGINLTPSVFSSPSEGLTPQAEVGAAPAAAAKKATLQRLTITGDTLAQSVTLPHRLVVDHALKAYRIVYGPQALDKDLGEMQPASQPARTSRDTLTISFPNPHRQPLRWSLSADTKVLASGDETNPAYTQSGFAPGTALTLRYRYLAGGRWKHRETDASIQRYDLLTEHKNVLGLTLTQPAKVLPGETVRVTVDATDQKGRPAAGVRLTAGTYNARFEDTPVTTPSYSKRTRVRRKRQDYDTKKTSLQRSTTPPRWLVKSFGLDTALAYQLRYPDPDFRHLRSLDTLLPYSLPIAHFAPFVIKNRKPVTIRTVYADDRLVYWYHPNIKTPYSIPLDSGRHVISLRTHRHKYTRELYFPNRQQLILSFDAERWVSAGWQRETIKEPTDLEVKQVHDRVFALEGMGTSSRFYYRTGKNQVIQSGTSNSYGRFAPLGLARKGQKMDFWFPSGDSVSLVFEPRATYRITHVRDRLYPLEKAVVNNAMKAPGSNGPGRPGVPQYRYNPPKAFIPRQHYQNVDRLPTLGSTSERSRIQTGRLPEGIQQVIVALANTEDYYYLRFDTPNIVEPGLYDVLYHFENDSVRHQQITLGRDSLTLLHYRKEATEYYQSFDPTKGYSETKPPEPEEEEEEIVYVERMFNGDRISGTVVDETGEPLIGVSILIEGTTTGTVTDFDGNYSLEIPTGDVKLIFSYTGYATNRIDIDSDRIPAELPVTLDGSAELLEEVVVVGYGTVRKRNLTGSITTIVQGKAAGISLSEENINIRGSRTNAVEYYVDGVRTGSPGAAQDILIRGVSTLATDNPIYLVDGVLIEDLSQLPTDGIVSVNVVKDGSYAALYGTRAVNGVVVITTGSGEAALGADLPAAEVREDFSDYAAFVPDLRTDAAGRASFDVTFPDDITAWNTFAVGQDRRRRVGFAVTRTNAFLPLQAQLYLPRFLVEGDTSEAATVAINRTEAELPVQLSFSGEGISPRPQDAVLKTSSEERFPIFAGPISRAGSTLWGVRGAKSDSLTYQFTVQATDGSASDGERRSVRVYPHGTEMTAGELLMLTEPTCQLPDEFIRPERGPVVLNLLGNRVKQLLADVDHVVDYPYACNEQTASRLLGLLALKDIRAAEDSPFAQENDIQKMIRRLEKLRRPDGGFGWWPASTRSTRWISLHVFRALAEASDAGYAVDDLQSVRRYLLSALPEQSAAVQLQVLSTLGELGFPPTREEITRLDTFTMPNDYELLAVARLHQLRGDTVDVDRLLDSSSVHAVRGRYWGTRRFRFGRQPLNDRLACGLLAQTILRKAGREAAADATVNYLLGSSGGPRPGGRPLLGTNTLESAQLIASLLPVLLDDDPTLRAPTVSLKTDARVALVDSFPYTLELPADEAATLTLTRNGSGPLPVSAHQRWFETNPTPTDSGFVLSSRLLDARGRPLDKLTRGVTATLAVTVDVAADADYVLIEIPIPAGCTYQDRNERRGPFAVHREYRRDRVAVFCDRLPAGRHVYKVALAPRFSGAYTLNPAWAEMQYLPVVSGNGELGKVRVE